MVGAALLAVSLAAVLAYRWATDPQRVRAVAVRYLEALTGADVSVDRARFSMFGGIELSGVRVCEPDPPPGLTNPEPILTCADLRLRHAPLAALTGRLVAEEIVALRPTLNVCRDTATGRFNVSALLGGGSAPTGRMPETLPTIRLRDARLRLGRRDGDTQRCVEELTVSLVAVPQAGDAAYEVSWKGGGVHQSAGRMFVDLAAGAVADLEGGLPWLTVEGAFLTAEARFPGAEDWRALLGLSGRFQVRDYVFAAADGASESARAVMELTDACVSLPLDEQEQSAPSETRYLRFSEVNGHLELTRAEARARLTGRLHGSNCELDVRFTRDPQGGLTLADIGFEGRVRVESLRLPAKDDPGRPDEARFVDRWRKLRHFYRDYDPHGTVNLEIVLRKAAGRDAPVSLQYARLESIDTDASYRLFSYRLTNLSGTAEYRPEGLRLIDLIGYHQGGRVTVSGTLDRPNWYTAGELHITGQDVPIDRDLHNALNEHYRSIWDRFELDGRADLDVRLTRAPGTPERTEPWRTVVEARFTDLDATFRRFPYPVEHLAGALGIDSQTFTVQDLSGRCGPGRVTFNGRATVGGDGSSRLDLRIDASDLAFEPRLLDALPVDARRLVQRFDPHGCFDLAGRLATDADTGRLTHDLKLSLRGAGFAYADLPIPVSEVRGEIELTPTRIAVPQLEGRWRDGGITIRGSHDVSAQGGGTRFEVNCRELRLDDELRRLLPETLQRVLAQVEIDGPLDTVTTVIGTGAQADRRIEQTTLVTLADTTLTYRPFPLPLVGVRGSVSIGPRGIELRDLAGECGEGRVTISGELVREDDGVSGSLHLAARGMQFDDVLREALPWRLRRTWNNARPTGRCDLELPRLDLSTGDGRNGRRWDFDARMTLADVSLDLGIKLDEAAGTLAGTGTLDAEGLELAGEFELDRARINGYELTGLSGYLARSADGTSLTFDELKGDLYGGSFAGQIEVDQSQSPARYACRATIAGAELRGLVNAGRPAESRPLAAGGRCDADLFIRGQVGDPHGAEGGGHVDLYEAQLFRLPLMLDILNVLDLAAPANGPAQAASADFVILGAEVELNDILVRDPTVALAGSGRLRRDPYELDLRLIAVSPHRWFKLPVVTELLEGAARELVELEVRGPLSGPSVQARPLRGVSGAMETLLGEATGDRDRGRR